MNIQATQQQNKTEYIKVYYILGIVLKRAYYVKIVQYLQLLANICMVSSPALRVAGPHVPVTQTTSLLSPLMVWHYVQQTLIDKCIYGS